MNAVDSYWIPIGILEISYLQFGHTKLATTKQMQPTKSSTRPSAAVDPMTQQRLPEDLESNASGYVVGISLLQQRGIEVRRNRVNWRSYLQSQMISEEEFAMITKLDAATQDERARLLDEQGGDVVRIVHDLMHHISKDQTVQYLLTMLDDWLQEDKSRVELFREFARKNKQSVFRMFLHIMNRPDPFIVHQASRIVAKIACWSRPLMDGTELQFYLTWLRDQLRSPANEYMQTTARCLQMMLRVDEYRRAFASVDGISTIVNVLSGNVNFQIQYQLIFCLWCMTFNNDLAHAMIRYNVVPYLADILADSSKEKVSRIILATFRQLVERAQSEKLLQQEYAVAMVHGKVLKNLKLLGDRKFDDPDIKDDIEFLEEQLLASVQDLSSLEEYVAELKSGRLEWSPVHKSEIFWRENAEKFNDRKYELLKILIHLLESSKDPLVLSVAAHDIGEFVRHYPRGKQVIEKLGGKTLCMQRLAHDDPNVRYQALLAVQKLMVHNWEYLGKQLEKDTGLGGSGLRVM